LSAVRVGPTPETTSALHPVFVQAWALSRALFMSLKIREIRAVWDRFGTSHYEQPLLILM